jgi:hypothetical protein
MAEEMSKKKTSEFRWSGAANTGLRISRFRIMNIIDSGECEGEEVVIKETRSRYNFNKNNETQR